MIAMLYLFDIDGTLLHCRGAGRRAFERACEELLGPASLTDITLDGMTDPLILAQAFAARAGRAPTDEEAAAIQAAYVAHLEAELQAAAADKLAGVDEALAFVGARGAVPGLATGNWRTGARVKLASIGLWERFALGGFGCDASDRGLLVRAAIERGQAHLGRGLRREEVIVIGDTPRDIAAAHAAGAVAVAVATGRYDAAALRRAGADAVYDDLRAWLAAQ